MFGFYSSSKDKNRISIVAEHKEGVLNIAASRCSSKDKFCRKIGREIAKTRLQEGKFVLSVKIEKCEGKLFLIIAKGLIEDLKKKL